jgi:hypothetical protein
MKKLLLLLLCSSAYGAGFSVDDPYCAGFEISSIVGDVTNYTCTGPVIDPTPEPEPEPPAPPPVPAFTCADLSNNSVDVQQYFDFPEVEGDYAMGTGEAYSMRFYTGRERYHTSFLYLYNTEEDIARTVSISESPCNFGNNSAQVIRFKISSAPIYKIVWDSHGTGQQSVVRTDGGDWQILNPGRTYYVNVKNEDPFNPGVDTCTTGYCGFTVKFMDTGR